MLLAIACLLSLAAVAFALTQTSPSEVEPAVRSASIAHEAAVGSSSAAPAESFDLVNAVFVFMLASFIGVGVIRRVSRLLHTPLMSLTNAISAIAVVGAILVAGNPHYPTQIRILGAIALFASMTNIVSGFLITQRMLVMFKQRDRGAP
jgi:NAD(P) transhydrogenase subunit alpha